MSTPSLTLLQRAQAGDIHAFQELFADFQAQLKSYLYRLTASRADAEDLAHDAFIRAYDKLQSFRGDASLKTWVFQIATNLALNVLEKRRRWAPDATAQAKDLVQGRPELARHLWQVAGQPDTRYEMREHIDTCFTCVGKTLPIENQVTLLLKDIYGFGITEIAEVLGKSAGVVKYLLQDARKTMLETFDQRCALINKDGVCNQCSELNGWFNPKQNQQEALMALDLVKGSRKYDREALYQMRTVLVQGIDPLRGPGAGLQEALMACNRMAMGEITP